MKIINKPAHMQKYSLHSRAAGKKIGFVPTMGALHDGHISLVKAARKENDIVVVSIFVNPIQFGPNEDLGKYPRTFENDCRLLKNEKTDFLFFPSVKDMYGDHFETFIDLKNLPCHLCGLKRPGHFQGVATVVAKLFNIVMPDISYFGQKDFQQARIIKRMTEDLNFPIKIKVIPIVREKNGLAMSSRNKYLSDDEKRQASALNKSLQLGKKLVLDGGTKSSPIIKSMRDFIMKEIPKAKIDYISITDPENLKDADKINGNVLIALAVFIGSTRLIDNLLVKIK